MIKSRWLLCPIVIVIAAILSITAFPGNIQANEAATEFEVLADAADSVVVGQVDSQVSRWNEEHTRIFTYVTVQVEDSLKGAINDRTITIAVPGGKAEGITQVVSETPSFNNGERMVVLLSRLEDKTYEVYGFNKGKYTLGKANLNEGKTTLEDLASQIRERGLVEAEVDETGGNNYGVVASPAISSVSPASASAGTASQVTISGSGFGAISGKVYFFYCSGESCIAGGIVSWTDTSIVVKVPVGTVSGYDASASSGWLYVQTSTALKSSYYPFEVIFSYGGVKWSGTSPVVDYYINPNTPDTSGEETAVQAAAATWSSVSGSGFHFNYKGTTGSTGYGYNSKNEIMWANLGSSGIIAQAVYWYSGSSLLETDIEFNEYFSWSASSSVPSGCMDIQSIALHELGHWLNLRDLYGNLNGYPTDESRVMYGFGSLGEMKRSLNSGDEAGIKWIYPGSQSASIALTSPNGAEEWQAGTTKTIAWSYSGSPGSYVGLQLYKSGTLVQSLTSSTSTGSGGSGSYSWNIPDTTASGGDYRVKITSLSNSTCYDYSNNYFNITGGADPPSITVTAPNGGETWQAGTSHTITWDYTGNPGSNVQIQLYLNGSPVSTLITSTSTGSNGQGSYAWTLSSNLAAGIAYAVKVSSTSNVNYNDASDSCFNISAALPPAISVVSPNGGETWQAGTSHNITWSYTGNPGAYVQIQLYLNGSLNSTVAASTSIGNSGQGSYPWMLSSKLGENSAYTIRISSTSNADYSDISDNCFNISAANLPKITVTSPNGGETWQAGTTHAITWSYSGNPGSKVKVQLYKGGNLSSTLNSSTSTGSNGQGSYAWTLSSSLAAGSTYTIKISSTNTPDYYDASNSYFNISAAAIPTITVTSPNGGEIWQAGTTHSITWSYNGNTGTKVKIQLYKGGKLSSTLASSTAIGDNGQGSYAWTISSSLGLSSTYSIKISSSTKTSCYDYSNGYFTVSAAAVPKITVTSPDGGETWQAGTSHAITWDYTNNPGKYIKIELYKNGSLKKTIVSSISIGSSGSGSYTWLVPYEIPFGSDYKIKVKSTGNANYYDFSNNYLTIATN
jgi:5-hydroxyisourate hydrolase-like protein (transthyretin family)